jgi:hypothetical protein
MGRVFGVRQLAQLRAFCRRDYQQRSNVKARRKALASERYLRRRPFIASDRNDEATR